MIICDELDKSSYWSFLSENEKTLLLQGVKSKIIIEEMLK